MLDSAADTPHWERFGFDKGQSETNRDRRPGLCLDPQARPFAVETHRRQIQGIPNSLWVCILNRQRGCAMQ